VFDNQQVMDLPKHSEIQLNPLADKALLHVQLNWLAFYIPFCAVLFAVCYFNEAFANKAQAYLLIGVPILILLSMLYNALSIKLQGLRYAITILRLKKGLFGSK